MTPERIGRYKIIEEIARGGMAAVFLAEDPMIRRKVAVKVLSAKMLATDPNFYDRFQQEAETIAALEHSAVIPIYDFGHQGDLSYIVMRYMPGGTLEARLQNGALPLEETSYIIERVGAALGEAHEKGILHRDIKPANILFNGRNEPFLSDFGTAKNLQAAKGITGTGVMIGTVEYMSPEQIQGTKELDGRTDIYALGIVLFFMLTGELPFKGDSIVSIVMAHLNNPIPSVQAAIPTLPSPWDELLQKALAKDPQDRYQTVDELVQAVKELIKKSES
ncbi:serine/threonine protein kinase [Candidatus Leptofilum sp.]|uniref:serine/threonine protein kinase n=1 Tax=Candidatus Leptofilum sp. TaxID=3241576 RepID=UPI003B5A490E